MSDALSPANGFSDRVDHSAPISPSIVAALVQTDGRLVCHTLQPPPRREHVPRSGPGSVEGGLSVILFVKPFELCLPPPFSLLPKVFWKAGLDQATMILVASRWPDRPWFPGLLALMHVPPLKLHIGPKTLIQSRSGFPDGNPHVLDLHASLLRRACCLHQARLRKTLALVRNSHWPGTQSIYAALLTWCGKEFNSLRLPEEGHSASTIRGYRPAISALPP